MIPWDNNCAAEECILEAIARFDTLGYRVEEVRLGRSAMLRLRESAGLRVVAEAKRDEIRQATVMYVDGAPMYWAEHLPHDAIEIVLDSTSRACPRGVHVVRNAFGTLT